MAARDVATLLDCSNCEMPLVVLPLALFPSVADWDGNQIAKLPGEVTDHEGERVAMYTRRRERHVRVSCVFGNRLLQL